MWFIMMPGVWDDSKVDQECFQWDTVGGGNKVGSTSAGNTVVTVNVQARAELAAILSRQCQQSDAKGKGSGRARA